LASTRAQTAAESRTPISAAEAPRSCSQTGQNGIMIPMAPK
jgi:hypothetical protein